MDEEKIKTELGVIEIYLMGLEKTGRLLPNQTKAIGEHIKSIREELKKRS
jgi:hypothetical protein